MGDSSEIETLGGRLCAVRGTESQADFAARYGVSRSTLIRYEKDETPPDVSFVERLYSDKGLNPTWLITGHGPQWLDRTYRTTQRSGGDFGAGHVSSEDIAYSMPPSLRHEIRERAEKWGVSLSLDEAVELVREGIYVWVPYYDLPLSGGGGAEVLDQPPKQWNFYTRQYIANERGLNGANLAEFPVRGHSMVPELHDRDTVMVDRSRTEIIGVDLFALRVGSQFFVKYLECLPDDSVRASSANEEGSYKPFIIPAADFESGHAKVIGRVMRKGQDR